MNTSEDSITVNLIENKMQEYLNILPNIVRVFDNFHEYMFVIKNSLCCFELSKITREGDLIIYDCNTFVSGAIFLCNKWVQVVYERGMSIPQILLESKKKREIVRKSLFKRVLESEKEDDWTSNMFYKTEGPSNMKESLFKFLDSLDKEMNMLDRKLEELKVKVCQ